MSQLQSPVSRAGSYPFERFSDLAKTVLATAQKEAVNARKGSFDTDHLVLALLTESDTVARETLVRLGVKLGGVWAAITSYWGTGAPPTSPAARAASPWTIPVSRAKRVLALAFDSADKAGRNLVGTGDLLIGVLTVREGIGSKTLVEAGATVEEARNMVTTLLAGGQFRNGG